MEARVAPPAPRLPWGSWCTGPGWYLGPGHVLGWGRQAQFQAARLFWKLATATMWPGPRPLLPGVVTVDCAWLSQSGALWGAGPGGCKELVLVSQLWAMEPMGNS